MRISIMKTDRGYDPTHSRRVRAVRLNGRVMEGVVTADEEEGFILAMLKDPLTGRWMADGDEWKLARETGKVEIELAAEDPRKWDPSRGGQAKVQVGRDRNGDVLVQVYSNARPGAIKQGRMHLQALPSGDSAVCQKAGATAGALAELLAEQFGDRIDPSAAAAEAVRQCACMLRDENRGDGSFMRDPTGG